jgi:hypothetical protein
MERRQICLAQIALGFPGAIYPFEEFLGLLQIVDVLVFLAASLVILENSYKFAAELLLVGHDFIGLAKFTKFTYKALVRDGWVGPLVVSNWEVEQAGVALRFPFAGAGGSGAQWTVHTLPSH